MKWKTPLLFLPLPLLFTAHALAQGPEGAPPILTLNGASVKVSSGALLDVHGPILNNGSGLMTIDGEMLVHDWITNNGTSDFSTGTGSVIFIGSGFQTIEGSHPSSFPALIVAKTGQDLVLNQDVTVQGDLILDQGRLDLNGRILTLGADSELLGEDGAKYVFGASGKIAISLPLNAPTNLNVANLGAVVTASGNLGTTTVIRGHEAQTGAGGNESILRYYEINPVNNSSLNATLEFRYLDHELNGQAEDQFILYRSTDGGTTWKWGGGTVNPGANYVVLSGIGSFSRWTVANRETNPISDVQEVSGRSNALSVLPNPARLGEPISIGLLSAGDYTADFTDAQGRVVSSIPFSSAGPGHRVELQPLLPATGTYFLMIRNDQLVAATSIIIH